MLVRYLSWFAPLVALALGACGEAGNHDKAQAGGEHATNTMTMPGGAAVIHLVIKGGPHAGTYDAVSNNVTCTHGFAGAGSWGNQYSVSGRKRNELSSLQLIVPSARDAADGTTDFLLSAGFGDLMQQGYVEYRVNTRSNGSKREGSGTISVEDRGQTGTVVFRGVTEAGIAVDGTIECNAVMRGDG